MCPPEIADHLIHGAGMYRYFLRQIKQLQEILETEKLPESEQQEILRTKDYMEKQAQRYQHAYREFVSHSRAGVLS